MSVCLINTDKAYKYRIFLMMDVNLIKHENESFTLVCRVDYCILINWMSQFPFLGVAGVLFSFLSLF